MAKKYAIYSLVAHFGEVNEEFETYQDAVSAYGKASAPKTLYGEDEQGSVSVIFSKG